MGSQNIHKNLPTKTHSTNFTYKNSMSESKSRRTRRGDASDAAGIKVRTSQLGSGGGSIVDKFKNAVNEKSDRQAYRDALDVAYKRQSDKKKLKWKSSNR